MLTRVLRAWLPTGGGLRDEDWVGRHRLLTLLLAGMIPVLSVYGVCRHQPAQDWEIPVLLLIGCLIAAVKLPPRRLPSMAVSLGFTVACAGLVTLSNGLTEAHFSFFIAVAALALYRDWAPFGVFLVATTLHHAVFGVLVSSHTYDHHEATAHPLLWAVLHGGSVLLAAGFQVIGWRLSEIEERRAQENLNDREAQLRIAFEETPVPMAIIAPDGRFERVNASYRKWLSLPDELPPGFSVPDLPLTLVSGRQDSTFGTLIEQGGDVVSLVREYRRHDTGEHIWVEVHSSGLKDDGGNLRLIFVHCLDVTIQHRHAEQLRDQVRHDALTGLLSRAAFEHDLAALLAHRAEPVSVLYLDVDRFKSINDGSGHGVGDDVLRTLADRLRATVPAGSLVARLGGDEFVVALASGQEGGIQAARAVLAAVADPFDLDGNHLQLAVSVGLATAQGAGHAEDAVLSADTAMYAAKRGGGNRVEIFNDDMRTDVRRRILSESRLRTALAGDPVETLPVWFQPVVSTVDGKIIGAEALVRMRTPDGEILAPFHFISAAEETGLVVPLGEHVLRRAVHHLLEWGDRLGYVSVNVSPRQLAEPTLVPTIAALLASAPSLDPSRLVLEITETALLGSSVDVQERLQTLKSLGVRIALDDFGTGYSSLTWLQNVPADVVKLDRSFVAGLAHDPRKSSIISAVLWLARSLGMSVTAEGVEDADDWNALRAADCPAVQGYYISKPLPVDDFTAFLDSRSPVTTATA